MLERKPNEQFKLKALEYKNTAGLICLVRMRHLNSNASQTVSAGQ